MDHVNKTKRSKIMAAVKSKHTKPEVSVRRLVYGLGYRYRLHVAKLPGCPDLAFSSKRKAIFVNGCFWHRHAGCRYSTTPKTKRAFWNRKFNANIARDQKNLKELKKQKWKTLVIWQCEINEIEKLTGKINAFLTN